MNLGEARSALMDRGFEYLTTGSLDLMLNRARNDFEDHWPWPWLRSYLLGVTAPIDLPDFKYMLSVSLPGQGELLGLEDSDIARIDTASTPTSSLPEYWYLAQTSTSPEGVTLTTWPDMGAALNVIYVRQTNELTTPTQTPEIPARYHSVWIDYAVVQGYKDRDNFPAAQALAADVEARMQRLIERYETRNRQHSRMMAIRFASEDD